MTARNFSVPDAMVENYFTHLTNQFFKILPLKEEGSQNLRNYMLSLQVEMSGLMGLMSLIQNDSRYLSLLATLDYLIEHKCETAVVRREVFKSINICKKLKETYCNKGGDTND